MKDELVTLKHYYSTDELEKAVEILEDAGISTVVDEEARTYESNGGVYALEVRESQAERAEELLALQTPSEETGAIEMLHDWKQESEEVKEAFLEH